MEFGQLANQIKSLTIGGDVDSLVAENGLHSARWIRTKRLTSLNTVNVCASASLKGARLTSLSIMVYCEA